VTAVDGDVDRFRIRIWSKATGANVYDNGTGDDQALPPPVGGGSIVVHVN